MVQIAKRRGERDKNGGGVEAAERGSGHRCRAYVGSPRHVTERGAMFFSGFEGVWRTLVVGLCAYVALVGVLRITGKRTLSKMNAFDLIVTVALGSTLATILLSKDVALAEGVMAFLLLAGAQYAVTWTSLRSSRFRRWIKAEPRALLQDGHLILDALRAERVTPDEVSAAIRGAGHADADGIALVMLETDGSMSVVPQKRS